MGILATVLVQSSAVTTATVVALVGAGQVSVGHAVPIVVGANVGTSITNTLVSMGHITRREEFRRAIIVHATVYGVSEFSACLVLMSITKDAERIGDYAKNILDLATIKPKPKGSPCFDQLLGLEHRISKMLQGTREIHEAHDGVRFESPFLTG